MSERRGRLAAVFPGHLEPVHLGKDVGLIPAGLAERGWDVELHCLSGSGAGWPFPVRTASAAALASPARWAGFDAALVYSFMRHAPIVRAARDAGAVVVAKGDTDGLVSARLEPAETFEMALHHIGTLRRRVSQLAFWVAWLGPLHRVEMNRARDAVAASHAFVVESDPARRRIVEALRRHGVPPEVLARLVTVPNPVDAAFTRGPVGAEREPLVVAVGRWDATQKNGPLLARALRRFLAEHPRWSARVVGAGGERVFSGMPRVAVSGPLPREEIAALYGRARIVASSSRYESFALSVHEGLASGCSLAAPPLAPFRQVAELGAYGTLAAGRGPAALASALAAEAGAWESGARDPLAIASFWRARLDHAAVAERIETLLEGSDPNLSRGD